MQSGSLRRHVLHLLRLRGQYRLHPKTFADSVDRQQLDFHLLVNRNVVGDTLFTQETFNTETISFFSKGLKGFNQTIPFIRIVDSLRSDHTGKYHTQETKFAITCSSVMLKSAIRSRLYASVASSSTVR